ncbi:hypothetical protein V2G26_004967 [Clonostachys chloroleuca]
MGLVVRISHTHAHTHVSLYVLPHVPFRIFASRSLSHSPPADASLGSAAVDIERSVELTFGCPRFSCLSFFQRAVDGRRARQRQRQQINQHDARGRPKWTNSICTSAACFGA